MGNRVCALFAFTAALKQTLQTNSGDMQIYKDKVQKLQNELIKVFIGAFTAFSLTYFTKMYFSLFKSFHFT